MAQFWAKTHTLIIQSHILYIFIINFCCCLCSQLLVKINSFYTKSYDIYWNQLITDFNICCIQNRNSWPLFSVLTIYFMYLFNLFLRVHNPVIHNYSLSGQLTVHYYIVFYYICKALLIYNT